MIFVLLLKYLLVISFCRHLLTCLYISTKKLKLRNWILPCAVINRREKKIYWNGSASGMKVMKIKVIEDMEEIRKIRLLASMPVDKTQ
jgi:hypothetical protein